MADEQDGHTRWLRQIAVPLPGPEIDEQLRPQLALFDQEIEAWKTTRMMHGAMEAFSRLQYWSEALASMQIDAANDDNTTLADALLEGRERSRYGDRKQSTVNAARMSQAARLMRNIVDPDHGEGSADSDLLCDMHFHVMGCDPDGPARPGQWRTCEMDIVDHRDGHIWNTGVRAAALPQTMELFSDAFKKKHWQQHHPLVRASWAHLALQRIHPFTDGNGRVGRLMVDGMHCEDMLPMVPLNSVLENRRPDYHNHISDAIFSANPAHYAEFHVEASTQAARHLRTHARGLEEAITKVNQAMESVEDIGGPRARHTTAMTLVGVPVMTTADLVARNRRHIQPEDAEQIFNRLADAGLGEHRRLDRPLTKQGRAGQVFVVTCGLQAVRNKPEKYGEIQQNPPDFDALRREAEAAKLDEDRRRAGGMTKEEEEWWRAERLRQYKKDPSRFNYVGTPKWARQDGEPER